MLNVAVCDDDINVLKELSFQIEAVFQEFAFPISLQSFSQVEALWRQWEIEAFDVLFLDIDMPETDGIAFGHFLRTQELHSCIVYISNREERVFETFSIAPLRFIRKSNFFNEIHDAVQAIIQWSEEQSEKKLVITSKGSINTLMIDDIIYVECFSKLQNIITVNHIYPVRSTLRELETRLQRFGFLRPHKGYLINYRHIERIELDNLFLINGKKIPISRSKIKETKQAYLRLITHALNLKSG